MSRRILLVLGLLMVMAGLTAAQPVDGDLIVSNIYEPNPSTAYGGFTAIVASNGSWTTLAGPIAASAYSHNWVRMAANNTDVVIGGFNTTTFADGLLFSATPGGTLTTLTKLPGTYPNGFALDGDGNWIICGSSTMWSFDDSSLTLKTLFTHAGPLNEMTIDRDPGAPHFVIAIYSDTTLTTPTAKLFGANATGITTTIVLGVQEPLKRASGVELDPRTGHYLVCDFNAPQVSVVNKAGAVVSSLTVASANGAAVNRDGTAWVCGTTNLALVDLVNPSVLKTLPITNPGRFAGSAVEVSGSRQLVCDSDGKTVAVYLQSRRKFDGNKAYQLACSFGRRPSSKMPSGEFLCMAIDPLLMLSISGNLPGIFSGFAGTTNAFGNASAKIMVPKAVQGLGIPIFVAGVLYDKTGIQTVTNTHWFTL